MTLKPENTDDITQDNKSLKYYFGGSVKAFEENGKRYIEGTLVPFGDPTNRDLDGEYFNEDTQLMLAAYPIEGRPVLIHHGMGKPGVIPVGTFIKGWFSKDGFEVRAEMGMDEEALNAWEKELLIEREEYKQLVDRTYKLVNKGVFDFSSGSLPPSVKVSENGHIERWALIEGSLTHTPAEPFKAKVHTAKSMQAALIEPIAKEADGSEDNRDNEQLAVHEDAQQPKSIKDMKMELNDEQRQMLAGILTMLLDDSEMEVSKQEEEELLEEVEKKAEEAVDEELPEEEDQKSMTAEKFAEIVNAHMPSLIPGKMKAHIEAKRSAELERQSSVAKAVSGVRDDVVGGSQKKRLGGYRGGDAPGQLHYSLDDERRFAGATAADMALGAKIMGKALFPHVLPQGLKMGQLGLSEGYIVTMSHKIADELKAVPDNHERVLQNDKARQSDQFALKMVMRAMKANELEAIAATNQGAEWAYTWYDTDLWERGTPETQLFDMMVARGMRTVDVPGKTMNVKLNTSSPTVYTVSEGRSLDSTGAPEAVVQLTPWGTDEVEESISYHVLGSAFTDQLNEQSIIDIAQFINTDAARTMQEAQEDAIINGDKTASSSNINTDGTPGTGMQKPLYLAWDGIRHNWLIDNTTQRADAGGSLVIEDYLDTFALFDQPLQSRKNQMLYVIDSTVETATRKLAELQTVNVAGESRATIFHGNLPPLFGIDIYVSGLARKAQADGTISATAASNTTGSINCAFAPYWQYGRQRATQIELNRVPRSLATEVVVSIGHVLKARGADAACGTRNVGV